MTLRTFNLAWGARTGSVRARVMLAVAVVIILAVPFFFVAGWGRDKVYYSQETPDAVLASAMLMVKNGEASKLTRLFYADSAEFRAVLSRLGKVFGSLQDLGVEVAKRFPDDVARLKKQVEESATGEGAQKLAAAIQTGEVGKTAAPVDEKAVRAQEREFQDMAARIFADPFSWLQSAAGRLTTQKIADDQAAILLDGKPVPPIGLTMRRADGLWYVELPTSMPMLAQYMPQTHNEWSIIGSLLKVLDNAIGELNVELRAGGIRKMDQLAEKAGEKAFVPAAMVFIAYGKEMNVRGRRERLMRDFKKRQNDWAAARKNEGVDADLVRKFTEAVNKVAVEALDKVVRDSTKDPERVERLKFAEMPEPELCRLIDGWLAASGVKLSMAGPPTAAQMQEAVDKVSTLKKSDRLANSKK